MERTSFKFTNLPMNIFGINDSQPWVPRSSWSTTHRNCALVLKASRGFGPKDSEDPWLETINLTSLDAEHRHILKHSSLFHLSTTILHHNISYFQQLIWFDLPQAARSSSLPSIQSIWSSQTRPLLIHWPLAQANSSEEQTRASSDIVSSSKPQWSKQRVLILFSIVPSKRSWDRGIDKGGHIDTTIVFVCVQSLHASYCPIIIIL